jgi:N-acetylmuramoyl-L-alanine amidase
MNLPIKKLVVHVTDTPDNKDFTAANIRQWHLERGWNDIGYHYVVRRDAAIEQGRTEDTIGAHTYGYNKNSFGIVWVGRDRPEPGQYLTLIHLLACLCRKHEIGAKDVTGHREWPNQQRTCPNLDMDQVRADVAARLAESRVDVGRTSCDRVGGACRCAFIGKA